MLLSLVLLNSWSCGWFLFLFETLWLGAGVFDLFIVVGFFLLILLSPCYSLEVIIGVRELQSVWGWTRGSPGLESSQSFSPPPQSFRTWQAADRCLWSLPGELEWELTPPWFGWLTIMAIDSCPPKFFGPKLSGGTTERGRSPGNTKRKKFILT